MPATTRRVLQAGGMSVLHCPLCIGLAVLSVVRSIAHLALVVSTPLARLS